MGVIFDVLLFGMMVHLLNFCSVNLYVENDKCKADSSNKCTGTESNPFSNIIDALQHINSNEELYKAGKTCVILRDSSSAIQYDSASEPGVLPPFISFFGTWTRVDLEINSDSKTGVSELFFKNGIWFNFLIKDGILTLKNIEIKGSENLTNLEYSPILVEKNILTKGLFILIPTASISVEFINCSFFFILTKPGNKNEHAISSVIYTDTIISPETIVAISLSTCIFDSLHYPKGIIYAMGPPPLALVEPKIKINIVSCHLRHYNNQKFLHWMNENYFTMESNQYYDFSFIVNNTLINLENLEIFSSSRTLLADSGNFVTLLNLHFTNDYNILLQNSPPPEVLYFIQANKVTGSNISFKSCVFASYDDKVNPVRDGTLFRDFSFKPFDYRQYERGQALIRFDLFNIVNFSRLLFSNSTFLKRDNLIFGVVYALGYNTINFSNVTIERTFFDTETRMGCLSFFYFSLENKVNFTSLEINNFDAYGYTMAQMFFALIKNNLTIVGINMANISLKSKASLTKMRSFIEIIKRNQKQVFVIYTEEFTCTNFILVIFSNILIVKNSVGTNMFSFFGGLAATFYMNEGYFHSSNFDLVVSEQLSNYLTICIFNRIIATNLTVKNTSALTGSIYLHENNVLYLNDSKFINNKGIGGSDFYDFYSSGYLSVGFTSAIVLVNVSVNTALSDTMGGSITLGENNILTVIDSNFIYSESSNSLSLGGVIFVNKSNNITFIQSAFDKNIGYKGGILYSFSINLIIIVKCNFTNNMANRGSVFYLVSFINLTVVGSFFYKNTGNLNGGLLLMEGDYHFLNFTNCSMSDNSVLSSGSVFLISSSNKIFFLDLYIENPTKGEGIFMSLDFNNTLKIQNFTFFNSWKISTFVKLFNYNFVYIEIGLVQAMEFIDDFLDLNENNNMIVKLLTMKDLPLDITVGSIIRSEISNDIKIYNLTLTLITASSPLLLTAINNNKILVENFALTQIKLNQKAVCLNVIKNNDIYFRGGLFQNIEGLKNPIFLLRCDSQNTIKFDQVIMSGYFNYESSTNSSSIYFIDGMDNSIILSSLSVNISNMIEDKTVIDKLNFILMASKSNLLKIDNSKFKLQNFFNFILSSFPNTLWLTDSIFSTCNQISDLLSVSHCELTLIGIIFNKNIIPDTNYLIRAVDNSILLMERVTLNTNSNFIFLKNSLLELNASIINSCAPQTQILQRGRLLTSINKGKSTFKRVEIFCRSNQNDSIILASDSELEFYSCIMGFNEGITGGLAFLKNGSNLTLSGNRFLHNRAIYGGVMYISDFKFLSLLNNTFVANKAYRFQKEYVNKLPGKGGCFFLTLNDSFTDFSIKMKFNNFILIGAEMGGVSYISGFHLYEYIIKLRLRENNKFSRSRAKFYGNDIASFAMTLGFIKDDWLLIFDEKNPNRLTIENKIDAGKTMIQCLFFVANVDIFKQVSFQDEAIFNRSFLSDEFQLFFRDEESLPCLYLIRPLTFEIFAKYTESKAQFIFNISNFINTTKRTENFTFSMDFKLKKCAIGQYFDLNRLECFDCEPNFFSFTEDFLEPSTCKNCAQEPFNCYGGFNVTPKSKYWRASPSSVNFLKCPIPSACLGEPSIEGELSSITILHSDYSYAFPIGICALGYQGVLCNECIPGYSKIDGSKCTICSGAKSIVIIVTKILLRVFFYFYMIIKALDFCKSIKKNKISLALVYSNFMIKIMILHIQFINAFLGFPFSIPEVFRDILTMLQISFSTGFDKAANLDCFYYFKNFKLKYIYNVLTVINPFIFVFLVMTGAYIIKLLQNTKIKRRSKMKSIDSSGNQRPSISIFFVSLMFKDSFFSYIIMISYMLFYDEIISSLMENFSFININDSSHPENRLIGDFEINFDSVNHRRWILLFVSPLTILIGVLLPIFILINIWRGKQNKVLANFRFLFRFGYFIFPYSPDHNYYEFFYMARKIFLITADIFFIRIFSISERENPITFMILMCFVFTFLSFYCSVKRPYNTQKYPILNRVEYSFLTVQALMSWVGCLFLSLNHKKDEGIYIIISALFFAVIGLANIFLLITWIYHYWKYSVQEKMIIMLNKFRKFTHTFKTPRSSKNKPLEDPEFMKVSLKMRKVSTFSSAFRTLHQENDFAMIKSPSDMKINENLNTNDPDNIILHSKECDPELYAHADNISPCIELGDEDSEEKSPPSFRNEYLFRPSGNPNSKDSLTQEIKRFQIVIPTEEAGSDKISNLLEGLFSVKHSKDLEITANQIGITANQKHTFKFIAFTKSLQGSPAEGYWLFIEILLEKTEDFIDITEVLLTSNDSENFSVCLKNPIINEEKTTVDVRFKIMYKHLVKLRVTESINFHLWFPLSSFQKLSFFVEVNCFDFMINKNKERYPKLPKSELSNPLHFEELVLNLPKENLFIMLSKANQDSEIPQLIYIISYKTTLTGALSENKQLKIRNLNFNIWLNNLRNSCLS